MANITFKDIKEQVTFKYEGYGLSIDDIIIPMAVLDEIESHNQKKILANVDFSKIKDGNIPDVSELITVDLAKSFMDYSEIEHVVFMIDGLVKDEVVAYFKQHGAMWQVYYNKFINDFIGKIIVFVSNPDAKKELNLPY